MHLSDTEAAQRVADNDNLVGELVEACKAFADYMCGPTAWTLAEADALIEKVHAVLAKAQGAQQ